MQKGVDLFGCQLVQPTVAAPRMVHDQNVERPQRISCRSDDALDGLGTADPS